ncbi:hypothetical protein BN405_2-10_Ab1_orf_28 [Pseudomonas phage vB_PaeM_C2-10_Ab1]|uniref:Uncharacterized protein n=1 Tax=Pseudomonas phage vB_PaeM_C2-10_Ab1 TaxID=1231048 RepID=K4RI22_9CAUD|nr:hypothetical protein BN405_2-10_Ab1_orf_28 [Pseudomonas phage vB_PaeM_C2-10_Ab1]CCM43572.1 hypothetical protein BN405_2-10_Ab1_orf_28 [Pseudomonas phage vB_PaeM_C2-10_Ab1]
MWAGCISLGYYTSAQVVTTGVVFVGELDHHRLNVNVAFTILLDFGIFHNLTSLRLCHKLWTYNQIDEFCTPIPGTSRGPEAVLGHRRCRYKVQVVQTHSSVETQLADVLRFPSLGFKTPSRVVEFVSESIHELNDASNLDSRSIQELELLSRVDCSGHVDRLSVEHFISSLFFRDKYTADYPASAN